MGTTWSGNDVGRAEELLDGCDAEFRGWEWHYLARRNRPGLFSAPRGPGPLLAFALTGGDRVVTIGCVELAAELGNQRDARPVVMTEEPAHPHPAH